MDINSTPADYQGWFCTTELGKTTSADLEKLSYSAFNGDVIRPQESANHIMKKRITLTCVGSYNYIPVKFKHYFTDSWDADDTAIGGFCTSDAGANSASVGELFLGSYFGTQYNGQTGFYSRFLLPPLAPLVTASQGELLDRIQLSWTPEPLGSFPSEGFNIYRDGVFLATVGVNIRNYNDFNVIAGRAYNYEVRGVNLHGEGTPGKAIGFQVPNGVVTGWIQTPSGPACAGRFRVADAAAGLFSQIRAHGRRLRHV